MCGVCGCGEGEAKIEGHEHAHEHEHEHVLADGSVVRHSHAHPAPKSRLALVEADILSRNAAAAAVNRARFAEAGVLALNLVSSPGAGKTTLLIETLARLEAPAAVIEGDQQTSLDADRIRATGRPAIQINTGKGCHLEADMVGRAFAGLPAMAGGVLFIENVGNLVCPAGFDLGEAQRVVIASVTEGEDKPLKYPDIFASADLLLVSKADIAAACGADIALLLANARKVRPGLPAILVSARTGEGLEKWLAWIAGALAMRRAAL